MREKGGHHTQKKEAGMFLWGDWYWNTSDRVGRHRARNQLQKNLSAKGGKVGKKTCVLREIRGRNLGLIPINNIKEEKKKKRVGGKRRKVGGKRDHPGGPWQKRKTAISPKVYEGTTKKNWGTQVL